MTNTKVFKEVSDAFQGGIKGIQKAADIYVKAIDEDPEIKTIFIAKFNHMITPPTWRSLELIGRKQVHPQLMLSGAANARYIKRLAYSDQEKILEGERHPCLLPNGDTIQVDLRTVDHKTADQMFSFDHIRSIADQKLWLEQRVPKRVEAAKNPNYEIIHAGKTVRFLRPCEYTKKELEIIWRSMN